MTAQTTPGAIPADVRQLATRIVAHCQNTAPAEAVEIVSRILADRAARLASLEAERARTVEALDDKSRDVVMDAAYRFVLPKLSDMQKEKGAVGVWVDAYRAGWDAAARAALASEAGGQSHDA